MQSMCLSPVCSRVERLGFTSLAALPVGKARPQRCRVSSAKAVVRTSRYIDRQGLRGEQGAMRGILFSSTRAAHLNEGYNVKYPSPGTRPHLFARSLRWCKPLLKDARSRNIGSTSRLVAKSLITGSRFVSRAVAKTRAW